MNYFVVCKKNVIIIKKYKYDTRIYRIYRYHMHIDFNHHIRIIRSIKYDILNILSHQQTFYEVRYKCAP